MTIQVVCNEMFLFKLPSDFGFFQEKASILKESVKTSTTFVVKSVIFEPFNLQELADLLYQAAHENSWVDPEKVEVVLGVTCDGKSTKASMTGRYYSSLF